MKAKLGKKKKKEDDKNIIASISKNDEVLVLSNDECLHVDEQRIEWIVGIATSYYATPHLELFSNYRVGDFGMVKIGNSNHSKIIRMSDICFETNVGWKLTLKDVRHVSYLYLNMMSGLAFDKQG